MASRVNGHASRAQLKGSRVSATIKSFALTGVSHMTKRVRLREKLIRQRTCLLTEWNLSLVSTSERACYADPADQASNDLEQDLAIQVKTRMVARLKRIEHALQLTQTKGYGCCRQCHKPIPYARLNVQPDALFCVSCLARMERNHQGHG